MLTSWFNGTSDLSWISRWKNTEVAHDYAAGYALHLIVWSGEGNSRLSTPYGPACGRAYPLSAQFLKDMAQLAQIFRGPPRSRLYVTLFAEFQTMIGRRPADLAFASNASKSATVFGGSVMPICCASFLL